MYANLSLSMMIVIVNWLIYGLFFDWWWLELLFLTLYWLISDKVLTVQPKFWYQNQNFWQISTNFDIKYKILTLKNNILTKFWP